MYYDFYCAQLDSYKISARLAYLKGVFLDLVKIYSSVPNKRAGWNFTKSTKESAGRVKTGSFIHNNRDFIAK